MTSAPTHRHCRRSHRAQHYAIMHTMTATVACPTSLINRGKRVRVCTHVNVHTNHIGAQAKNATYVMWRMASSYTPIRHSEVILSIQNMASYSRYYTDNRYAMHRAYVLNWNRSVYECFVFAFQHPVTPRTHEWVDVIQPTLCSSQTPTCVFSECFSLAGCQLSYNTSRELIIIRIRDDKYSPNGGDCGTFGMNELCK